MGRVFGSIQPERTGQHQVTLRCVQTDASLEAKLFVQGAALERIGKPARPEVLEELARVSKGKVLELDKMENVVEAISDFRIRLRKFGEFNCGVIRWLPLR